MNKLVVLAALFLFLSTAVSFETEAQILPTKLTVTVIDGLGNFVEGAEVKLYKTEADYRGSTNPAASGVSDKKGRVKFKEVQSVVYFLEVIKDDMNNNGEGVQTGPLAAKKTNKVNVVIE
ncbi:MAG: carboxypeptidase regulatory-like domain-containing protein [Cyclobacteriaceae bacterium]